MTTIADKEQMAKALRDIASEIATAEDFESGSIDVDFQRREVHDGVGTISEPTGYVSIAWIATFKPGRKTKIT